MTQKDLIDNIVNKTQLPAATVEKVIKAHADTVRNMLAQGHEITLHHSLGKLKVTDTKERQGRNPATGETITIPAGKRVKFMPAKGLKEAIN